MGQQRGFGRKAIFLALAGIAVIGLVALLASKGSAPQASGLAGIKENGVIRVGVNPNLPPMSYYGSTNQLEGFDIDLANRIADELGVKVQFVPTEAAQRVPFLTSGRIDFTLGALTITPERQRVIDYTIPVHTESMGVLTTERPDINSLSDLDRPEITLVNMRGNRSVAVLEENLPQAKKLLVDANADTVRAIAQGRADALVENVDFFIGFTKSYPNVKWRVMDEKLFIAQVGIGLGKGNDDLKVALNDILRKLHETGFIEERWSHWYGGPMSAPVDLEYGN